MPLVDVGAAASNSFSDGDRQPSSTGTLSVTIWKVWCVVASELWERHVQCRCRCLCIKLFLLHTWKWLGQPGRNVVLWKLTAGVVRKWSRNGYHGHPGRAHSQIAYCLCHHLHRPCFFLLVSKFPAECPLIPNLRNGSVFGGYLPGKHGDQRSFTCDAGFYRDGPSMVQCQTTGKWSGSLPRCLGEFTEVHKLFHLWQRGTGMNRQPLWLAYLSPNIE